MPRQVRGEVRLRRDRADTRAAAAVRDAERLVQVQVRDVAAEVAEAGEAEQRVEVRAVDVHLAARVVHGAADLHDSCSYTPCVDGYVIMSAARFSACSAIFARRSSRSTLPGSSHATTTTFMPASTADAAFVPCARRRDQAHRAVEVAVGAVVSADREQARELALRARVRLQRLTASYPVTSASHDSRAARSCAR